MITFGGPDCDIVGPKKDSDFLGVILSYLSDFSGESKEVSQKQVKKKKKGKNNNKNSSLMIIRKEHGR